MRKIAVYFFLISPVVPKLLRLKVLINDQKWFRGLGITCDVMSWTSGWNKVVNIV